MKISSNLEQSMGQGRNARDNLKSLETNENRSKMSVECTKHGIK